MNEKSSKIPRRSIAVLGAAVGLILAILAVVLVIRHLRFCGGHSPAAQAQISAQGLYPGDSVTETVLVEAKRAGSLYCALTADQDSDLAGVLHIRITGNGQLLYDGPVRDMGTVTYLLEPKGQSVTYELELHLGTEVGNEYQNLSFEGQLYWWTETVGSQCNCIVLILICLALAMAAALGASFLLPRPGEEAEHG